MAENIRKVIAVAVEDALAEHNRDRAWELIDLLNTINDHPAVQTGALPDRYSVQRMLLSSGEMSHFTESERLVLQGKQELDAFFGFDVEVFDPPQELLHALDTFRQHNVRGFAVHYLPDYVFRQEEELPGWRIKPEQKYWDLVRKGGDTSTTAAGWYLVDTYSGSQYTYEDPHLSGRRERDYLSETIRGLRADGQVPYLVRGSGDSRFGIGALTIENIIFPEFARAHGISQQVRFPTGIEFNVLGNMAHPAWSQQRHYEYFSTNGKLDIRFLGGMSTEEKAGEVKPALEDMYYMHTPRYDKTESTHSPNGPGFRPLIAFPAISQ